jgi:DNA-directed RNA polymerase specialized sigma24 family protein
MSTPSDPPPPALPMELDSTETQLVFFAQQCGLTKLNGEKKVADKFWNFLYPHLQKAFRKLVEKNYLNPSDHGDLHSVAATAVWQKIEFFDLSKAQNFEQPFTGWACYHGRNAITGHFQKLGLSRVHYERSEKITDTLKEWFPNGPEADETWLDLARQQAQELAAKLKVTEAMIRNTLAAWSLRDAEDVDNTNQAGHESTQRFTKQEIQWALAKLTPKARRFVLQKHVSGLRYDEIVEKYNIENPTHKETIPNARQIVSKACKELKEILGGLE